MNAIPLFASLRHANVSLFLDCQDCLEMTIRQRVLTETDVTFRANKSRVSLSLIDLVVEYSSIITRRGNVTAFSAAARSNWNCHRTLINRVHGRHAMAVHTTYVWVLSTLMSESSRRTAPFPCSQNGFVCNAKRLRYILIEVAPEKLLVCCQFVTTVTFRLGWWDSEISVVTGEANSMAIRNRFERPFL